MRSWVCPQSGFYDVLKLWDCTLQNPLQLASAVVVTRFVERKLKFPTGSRHLKFLLRLQHLKVFNCGSRMIWSTENRKPLYYLYNLLDPQTGDVEREPKLQAPAPPSKNFGLGLHHLRILVSGINHTNLLGLRLHSFGCDQTWPQRGTSG